jgi:NADH-quinone oxidoreductase subunit M
MTDLLLPWLEISILLPLFGAIWVSRIANAALARRWSILFAACTLICTLVAWADFWHLHSRSAHDHWDVISPLFGREILAIDHLSAPLLPLGALLYLLTTIATLRSKIRRFSFTWALISESLLLAALSCREPWAVVVLLSLSTIPPYVELKSRGKPTRVYLLHMGLFILLMAIGWSMIEYEGRTSAHSLLGQLLLVGAVLVRSGMAPVHCWVTDLFEHATFGRAILFMTPMMGAYAAVRLLLPIASNEVLHWLGWIAIVTAVYSAGMALVQREARRFFCYIFLSHSALVLVGLETLTETGLTGGLCVWLSIGLAMAGFGLTLRALEARHGRLSLLTFHGVYEHTPILAVCFLLTGMAAVGFPGTFGFLGMELLVDGAVQAFPYVGMMIVLAAALNGIAVMQTYFRLFTGARLLSSIPLGIGGRERLAVLTLATLILAGGLFPQPGVVSRFQAAQEILEDRQVYLTNAESREREVAAQKHSGGPTLVKWRTPATSAAP